MLSDLTVCVQGRCFVS